MSKLKYKLLSIFIILLVTVLPWRVSFAEVTDEKIKAAQDYHTLIINQTFHAIPNTPAAHLTYLQALINNEEELNAFVISLVEQDLEIDRTKIEAIINYLNNPPIPENDTDLLKILPSAGKYHKENTLSNTSKRGMLLTNIKSTMESRSPSMDIIEMDIIHGGNEYAFQKYGERRDGGKDGLNDLYKYLGIFTCTIF